MLKLLKLNCCLLLFLMCNACQQKELIVEVNDKNLSLNNEVVLYKEKPFTGVLQSKNDTLVTYKAQYVNGKKEGEEKSFIVMGKLPKSAFTPMVKKQVSIEPGGRKIS